MDRRTKIKILLLDIETAPNVAHVWGIWQQNVGVNQIMASGYVLSWAAKWLDEPEVFFVSKHTASSRKMIRSVHKLLSEADVVVHYNGTRFDIPTLNKEFLLHGLNPPSPFKQVDLLKIVRQQFRFPSNKLEYVARALNIGSKVKHAGHELWTRCMAGEAEAWKEMEAYNIQDVKLLESLYARLKPWIKGHPNHALYDSANSLLCPNCGSASVHRRGYTRTALSLFIRYQCQDCGSWARTGVAEKIDRTKILRPV